MDVSFLIPCARQWEGYGLKTFNSLINLKTDLSYEIIVCCPYDLELSHKKLVVLKDNAGSSGAVDPINKMCTAARGSYLILLNDEFISHPTILDVLKIFEETGLEVAGLVPDHFIDGVPRQQIPALYYPFLVNLGGCPLLPFPVISKKIVMKHMDGVLFNESFKHYGSDSWLSYYIKNKLNKDIHLCFETRTIFTINSEEPSIAKDTDNGEGTLSQLVSLLNKYPEMGYNTIV